MNLARHLQRRAALVPIVVAHAALLALVIVEDSGTVPNVAAGRSLAVFDVTPPAPRASSRPVSVRPVSKVIVAEAAAPQPTSIVALPDPVATPVLSEASLAPGETCDIAGKVQTALRDDPRVRGALGMLPRDARSVANAVMLWDGRWIAGTTTSTRYALDQIKAAVVTAVAAAPRACRVEGQAGPALMLVAGAPETVLALGSGRWRWTDVFGPGGEAAAQTIAARTDAAPPAT